MPHAPFIPENAPFNAAQRLWLNGFLAGLFATTQTDDTKQLPAGPAPSVLILYGSQTGTAEKLACDIARETKARGGNPRVLDAASHSTVDWKAEANLLVVTSTYGDGDMPDNAQGFWDWLQTDAAAAMAHLNFSVLALGDTAYEHFCAAGKKIDARLEQLGAKRIHPLSDCDLDYKSRAKSWMDGALSLLLTNTPASTKTEPVATVNTSEGYSKKNPFPAAILANSLLSGEGSEKETRHFEISLEGSGLNYEAGDALGIFPANCPTLVDELLNALGTDGEEAVPVNGGDLPLRKTLGEHYDIIRPAPELVRLVAEHSAALRELLAPARADDLRAWLRGRDLVDLMREAPGARFAPAQFVALLKPLAPRLYSISSSPKAHAGQVHLTVNIVRYQAHGRGRKGVASSFLADRAGAQTPLRVFVQTSHGFRLPAPDAPVIMVGPGTGIAPFRAFLHERRATGAKGHNWLFFGEQHAATDFYYREELEQMLTDGHLAKLSTAFSRDQSEKIYVQQRMLEHAVELWAWLRDGAHFYVCGDASRMAKDVDAALHKVIEIAGGLGADGAMDFVNKLKAQKRYQRDVY